MTTLDRLGILIARAVPIAWTAACLLLAGSILAEAWERRA
jgi:hypothetical protein